MAFKVFRTLYLPQETISNIPPEFEHQDRKSGNSASHMLHIRHKKKSDMPRMELNKFGKYNLDGFAGKNSAEIRGVLPSCMPICFICLRYKDIHGEENMEQNMQYGKN